MSTSLGPQRSGQPLRPVTPFFSEGDASDAISEASASQRLQKSSPGSPAGVHSPTSLTSNSAQRRGSIVNVRAEFIKSRKEDEPEITHTGKEKYRKIGIDVMTNSYISNLMAAVVLLDAYCTCADIDARAAGEDPALELAILSDVCLGLYTLELVVLTCLQGCSVFKDWLALLDLTIVLCGYLELLLNFLAPGDIVGNLGILRALRLVRIVRLMRLLRRIRALRELHKLVTMMATCLKALLWSFVFCFGIMTVWAMLMVEIVHPIIRDMTFEQCDDCSTAVASVMRANLLLFKTVIAGDSWGDIAVPVIESNPYTAFIFMGSLLTLVFGVLNLIVAVVVDTFAEAREQDVLNLAQEMDQNVEDDRKNLQRLFNRIDADGSGRLTLDELIEGARRDPELQSRLRVMDIDEVDLQQLFEMIDVHREGAVEAQEFIAPLSRWVHDSKTAPRFIKYNMVRTMQNQEELFDLSRDYFDFLAMRVDSLSESLQKLTAAQGLQTGGQPAAQSEMSEHQTCDLDHGMAAGEGCIEAPNASVKSQPQLLETPTEPAVAGLRKEQDPRNSKDACAGMNPTSSRTESTTLHIADAMQTLERFVHKATEESLRKTVTLIEQSLQGTNLDELLHRFERPHWPRARHTRRSDRRLDDDGLERVDRVGSSSVQSFSRQDSPGRGFDRQLSPGRGFDRQLSPGRSSRLRSDGLGPSLRQSGTLAGFASKDRPSSHSDSRRTSLQAGEARRVAGTAGHRSRTNSSESSINMGPIATIGAD
ncbi:CACNA1C [Symbiodinium necroappetens]|uniref:CACNA1C protein n=1 Tax=Symbiodinium necroappetens TaxID=1628268 RepID=A0A812IWI0_9DINO|nr:CACNA1C [Symbiodinium necroappetens]